MNREAVSSPVASIRRCPNCGTRVAQNAETCYFCGHDLTKVPRARRRITWLDLILVVALLVVVVLWWRMAGDTDRPLVGEAANGEAIAELTDPPAANEDAQAVVADDAVVVEPSPATTLQPAEIALPSPFVIKHEVQSGETLFGISTLYGVTVEELKAANGLQDELIRPGDELLVPVAESVAEGDVNQTVSTVFTYEVQAGDALVSIAIRFGTQVENILQANQLSVSDFIRPGQKLLVPVEQVPSAVLASSEAVRGLATPSPDSPNVVYQAPNLIGPENAETLPASETILFRWISVDLLAPNEWYVLRIWPLEGALESPPAIWTKTTSYRFETAWAPTGGRAARYGWQVTVVRVLPDMGDGRKIQTASTPSQVRTFTWQ
jgi:LysM repeat protein/predicted nucleic acid-binding Zn ribbon protein